MNHVAYQVSRERIPDATFHLLLDNANAVGLDMSNVLKAAGITYTQTDYKSVPPFLCRAQFAPIYQTCMQTLAQSLSPKDGHRPLTFDDIELMCACVVHCVTLEQAIGRAVRFAKALTGRGPTLALELQGDFAFFYMDTHRRNSSLSGLLCDYFGICLFYKLFSWLIGEALEKPSVVFSHSAHIKAEQLQVLLDCPVAFDGERNCLRFDRAMLSRPLVKTHAELMAVLQESPIELIPTPPSTRKLSVRLVDIFRRNLADKHQIPTAEQLAPQLGKSGPTLRRHLAEENTSFQVLLDQCRLEKAIELLGNPAISIDDISDHLGFSAPSGFSRAFKSWTGYAPSVYRRRSQQNSVV